jgi:glucosylceramidase
LKIPGIVYNVLRVPLAGVDFSTRKYTYNDQNNDFNLTSFSLQSEDINWKIPIIKAAQKLNTKTKIKLFASAWSSPPWMKTNNDYTGEGKYICL